MNGKLVLAALAAVGLLVIGLLAFHRGSDRSPARRAGPHAAPPSTTASSGATPPVPSSSSSQVTAAQVTALLPLGEGDIATGVELARHFITLYSTWRYDESPRQYYRRLAPLMSAQLRPQIENAASDLTLTSQRRRLQETSTGMARAQAIRSLGPTSITTLVAGTEHIAAPSSTHQTTSLYAVTMTRTERGWLVDALELATTGDTGDTPQPGAADLGRKGGDEP